MQKAENKGVAGGATTEVIENKGTILQGSCIAKCVLE
jgi:hypothetical protein